MTGGALVLAAVLAVGGAALAAALIVLAGLRRGSRRVRRAVARLNRATINRREVRRAGRRGATMSLLHHRGRRTGTPRATPVGATPVVDGFVIPLPYGPHTDWMRNLLASGTARLEVAGVSHVVGDPRVVPLADVLDVFGVADRRVLAIVGVREALRLTRIPPTIAA